MADLSIPNHHADHAGFAGAIGAAAGLGMLIMGRGYARLAVDLGSVTGADRVVDVGCGPGGAVRVAARRGATVVGVDPAPVMLQLASHVTFDQSRITWSPGSAEALPVPSGWATIVWSLRTVHHWKDLAAGLAEVRRVLAPAGRLLVVERCVEPGATGLASHGWTKQQVETFAEQCGAAGFDGVRIDRLPRLRRAAWVVHTLRGDQVG